MCEAVLLTLVSVATRVTTGKAIMRSGSMVFFRKCFRKPQVSDSFLPAGFIPLYTTPDHFIPSTSPFPPELSP